MNASNAITRFWYAVLLNYVLINYFIQQSCIIFYCICYSHRAACGWSDWSHVDSGFVALCGPVALSRELSGYILYVVYTYTHNPERLTTCVMSMWPCTFCSDPGWVV